MTVEELIKRLQMLPPDLKVVEVDYKDHVGPRYIDMDDVTWTSRVVEIYALQGLFGSNYYRDADSHHENRFDALVL